MMADVVQLDVLVPCSFKRGDVLFRGDEVCLGDAGDKEEEAHGEELEGGEVAGGENQVGQGEAAGGGEERVGRADEITAGLEAAERDRLSVLQGERVPRGESSHW